MNMKKTKNHLLCLLLAASGACALGAESPTAAEILARLDLSHTQIELDREGGIV